MKAKNQAMEENTYMSFDSLDIDSITLASVASSKVSPELCVRTKSNEIMLKSVGRSANFPGNTYGQVNTKRASDDKERSTDLYRGLNRGGLNLSDRRKLSHKFHTDDDIMSASDYGGTRTSHSSASESTGRADSLEGSPIPNHNSNKLHRRRSFSNQFLPYGNNKEPSIPQPNLSNSQYIQNGVASKETGPQETFSITTVTSPGNARKDTKQAGKRQQASNPQRQNRDQGLSASARRVFSSLRKTGRGRSPSRERTEKFTTRKAGHEAKVQDDLSSDANLPGILKIFGDAVSPGAKYKSVLATRQSKARELVKAAVERYGIPRGMARKFVLCEVVGRIREGAGEANTAEPVEESFVEDYARPLNDHEKPLILQSYWKPLEGYLRRFELRDRSQVLDQITTEKDRETKDVNAQAKRLIIKNARLSRAQSSISMKMLSPDSSTSDEDEESIPSTGALHKKQDAVGQIHNEAEKASPPTPPQFADDTNEERSKRAMLPVLLTLQGEDGIQSDTSTESGGALVHVLDTKVTVVGRDQASSPHADRHKKTGSSKDINIKLAGDEIRTHHCVVYRVKGEEDANYSYHSQWKVTLHLVDEDCNVAVNGQKITSDERLNNGDIITIGTKYIFMFKDPTSKDSLNSNLRLPGMTTTSASRPGKIASKSSAFTPVKKRCVDMEISYRHEHESSVLKVIFEAANDIVSTSSSRTLPENCERELAPARFIIHCIEHSCINSTLEQKQNLLFVIAKNLQSILLDVTDSVSRQDDNKIKNPQEGLNYILPKLEVVVFWMSNALEIFSYLQSDITNRISARVKKEMELNEVDANLLNEACSFRVTDDVLAVLEESVMYAFQQLVYYLTKTLYGALPKVLDANPFAEVIDDSETANRGVGPVFAIYDAAVWLTRKYGVQPAIESQLFAYLFFFTNVSLFNTLMEEGAVNKYYRWDKGVQIRGNLEEIECWANDNGFQEQALLFLEKISDLTNLLATTKTQMLQSKWSHFRRDFPSLTPGQLRHVLDSYILGPRVTKRPSEWTSDSEVANSAVGGSDSLLESYDNHPPLVLPMDGTRIVLDMIPQEAWYSALRGTIIAVGRGHNFETASSPSLWLSNSDLYGSDIAERQQYDDHGTPLRHRHSHSPFSSSSNSSLPSRDSRKASPRHDYSHMHAEANYRSSKLNSGTNSPSSTGGVSTPPDSRSFNKKRTVPSPKHATNPTHDADSQSPAARKSGLTYPTPTPRNSKSRIEQKPSALISQNSRSATKYATLDRPKKRGDHRNSSRSLTDDQSCDYKSLSKFEADIADECVNAYDILPNDDDASESEVRVLPISITVTKHSDIETQTSGGRSSKSNAASPSEVFIVDVVKGMKGLGLGLVDGMHTSLRVPGVFVRSIVPDGPAAKHVRMKHHQEVIKCWLQDGRLLLGDRILAVNGTSLVSMNYSSAMNELRQAEDQMRLLVGRSSVDVAMRITSSCL